MSEWALTLGIVSIVLISAIVYRLEKAEQRIRDLESKP